MIRLPNLLPTQTDAATTKRSDTAAALADLATPATTSKPAKPPTGIAADATTIASGARRELADLRAKFEQSATQDRAVAMADVALQGLDAIGEKLASMRSTVVAATSADFSSAFAAGKDLRTRFDELNAQVGRTVESTRAGMLALGDGPQSPSFAAPLADVPRLPELPDAGPGGLGLAGVSFGSRQDAATAAKAVDVAIDKVGASRKDVFQFREGVSKVAEAQRRELYNSGLLRGREEAMSLAEQVSKSLNQDSGDGQTVGMQLLAQSVPSAQSVLGLLRSE